MDFVVIICYNINMSKTGVALITCDRVSFFNKCLKSVLAASDTFDTLAVVNDGGESVDEELLMDVNVYIKHEKNQGVGPSKNDAIKALLDADCDHIFLIEDDVIIHDSETFTKYIHASEVTGIKHLNFCLHGNDNKHNGAPAPKLVIDYKDVKLALYHNVYGAVSYYHRSVIDKIGLMDEQYRNAMEHVDHTMLACVEGFHPPFRWFADLHESDRLIHEQDQGHEKSKIRSEEQWLDDFKFGVERFYNKFEINVCSINQPVPEKDEVIGFLREVKP